LIGNHLDDVGQVLAFGGELDHGALAEFSHLDALGNVAELIEEPAHARAGLAQLLAEPAMGDFEAPHGRPALFGIVHGGDAQFAFEPGKIDAGRTRRNDDRHRAHGSLRTRSKYLPSWRQSVQG
jgi:hypothetical protein